MDLDKIEQLVKIVENSSMLDFCIKEGGVKIEMSRRPNAETFVTAGAEPPVKVSVSQSQELEAEEEEMYIISPIVGIFYSASSPEEKPFVTVGDTVKAGQKVCILEAMKLLNEIESDFDCKIEAVLVSNEQKVEYGQPLFRVTPIID
ncbi:MAG: acetyl-CoA carboxylase biotin carboxyl carrier protein [Turicibacter sp.]|nr:acetyl-CoA carboxylase biotin carboxyl carrier protein [Turicibacter sp.]